MTKTINVDSEIFNDANCIEDILCLSTLVVAEILPPDSTVNDATAYQNNLSDCGDCPKHLLCLACFINQ